MVEKLNSFTTIKYVTSSGENCSATKSNGIVTVQGDKNGVRQIPYDKFMQEFLADQQKVYLERIPKQDTVSFSGMDAGAKLGPAGFGPGHPKHEDKNNKKAWILGGLGALAVGILLYVFTRGKVKSNAIAGLADDATRTASSAADDLSSKSNEVVEAVVEEVVPKAKPKAASNAKPSKPKTNPQPNAQPKVSQQQPKQAPKNIEDVEPVIMETVAKENPPVQTVIPLTVAPKTEKVITTVADDIKPTKIVDEVIGETTQKVSSSPVFDWSKPSANLVDDVTRGPKVSGLTDDLGYVADDAIDISRRGSYGQDLYDITDPRNYDDVLSPYYRPTSSFTSSLDDMLDPFGFNSPSSFGSPDPFNPF